MRPFPPHRLTKRFQNMEYGERDGAHIRINPPHFEDTGETLQLAEVMNIQFPKIGSYFWALNRTHARSSGLSRLPSNNQQM